MIRWLIIAIIAGLAVIAIAAWLGRPRPAASPQEQAFLRWETCVLNNQPRCGPMPTP